MPFALMTCDVTNCTISGDGLADVAPLPLWMTFERYFTRLYSHAELRRVCFGIINRRLAHITTDGRARV